MIAIQLSEKDEARADALALDARREFDAALARVRAAAPGVPADLWAGVEEAATGLACRTADSFLSVAFSGLAPARVHLRRV